MDGPDYPAPPAPARGRAARRGPAPGLRRAHPRAAPGGRLVGGSWDSRNSALGRLLFARDDRGQRAAERARTRRATPTRSRGSRSSRPTRPGCISVERSTLGPPSRWAGEPRGRRRAGRRAASTARSTGAGGAPRTATSPPARTRRAWRASPRRPSSTTSRRTRRRPRRRAAADGEDERCAARRAVAAGGHAGRGRTSARSCTACSRPPTSRRPTSTPSWPRGSPEAQRAAADRRSATRPRRSQALRAAIETPLGPLLDGARLRDIARRATASTSSTSSCRSPAATSRPAG